MEDDVMMEVLAEGLGLLVDALNWQFDASSEAPAIAAVGEGRLAAAPLIRPGSAWRPVSATPLLFFSFPHFLPFN